MANANIKISQLPNIGSNLNSNTLLPVVSTNGTFLTDKVNVGNLANFILDQAGNLLNEAFVAQISYGVANAAQPNITSVGNLTGLTITNLSNLHIPGGDNGYVLQTNGNGNLSWTAMAGSGNGSPGGSNTQIQFNDNGLFGGVVDFTYDKNLNVLTVDNINLIANLAGDYADFIHDVTANVVVANYLYGDGSNITNISIGAGTYLENGTSNVIVQSNGNINFSASGVANVLTISSTNVIIDTQLTATDGVNLNIVDVVSINVASGGNIYEDGSALIVRTEPTHIFEIWGNDGASDYKWSFDQDGHLTLPGNTAYVRGDVDLIQFYNNSDAQSGVSVFENFEISAANNIRLFANNDSTPFLWEFDNNGNLTTPSNLVIGSIPAGNGSSILQYDAPLQLVGEGSNSFVIAGWAETTSTPGNIAVVSFNSPFGGAGNVAISTGDNGNTQYNWNFDNTGNLTLPSEGNIVGITPNNSGSLQWLGNSSGDGNGYTTLKLIPDDSLIGGDQYVVLDPTAPGHIHVRAGGTIDNSFASLYLGGEQSYFMVPPGSGPSVYVVAGGNTWTFGNDGNLQLPGDTLAINFANGLPALSNLVQWTTAPVANTSNGTAGQAAYDSGGNLYVCVATDTWAKFAGTTSW